MKQLLGLPSASDQAAVLEAAFEALTLLTAANNRCSCHQIDLHLDPPGADLLQLAVGDNQPAKRPARMPVDAFESQLDFNLSDLDLDMDVSDLLSDPPLSVNSYSSTSSTNMSRTVAGVSQGISTTGKNEFTACMLSSLMTGGSVSLDSFFLKSTVAIFLNSDIFDFLDCNQAGLDMLGAGSKQAFRDMDVAEIECKEQDVVVDQDVATIAMNQLAFSDTVTTIQRIKRKDGGVIWIRSLMTKVVHNGSTPGYMGIVQHVLGPDDGRAKVWTNDHLVCVGQGSSHPPMV
jgi:PAS domain S-box-containing protein